jgi:hypothetical protein
VRVHLHEARATLAQRLGELGELDELDELVDGDADGDGA